MLGTTPPLTPSSARHCTRQYNSSLQPMVCWVLVMPETNSQNWMHGRGQYFGWMLTIMFFYYYFLDWMPTSDKDVKWMPRIAVLFPPPPTARHWQGRMNQ